MRPPKAITWLWLAAASILAPAGASRAELPPQHAVDESEVCLTCHDLADALGARVEHAPIGNGQCSACHDPHASRFDALLRERPATLCGECHEDVSRARSKPFVHEPVADGRCGDCHRPHGGEHDGLLVRPAKELCRECHEALSAWEARDVQHPPFAQGACDACHDPHASDHPGLLAASGGAACVACHAVDRVFEQRHRGYPVQSAPCRQCHDPHASSKPGLFRARLHEPFEEGDCTACHAAADASEPFALVAGEGELCGACHAEQVELSREAPFPHVSAGGAECSACHNPHTGDGDGLLHASMRELCSTCHDPGGAGSGESGRFLSHADLDCGACHAPHGGDEPLLLTTGSIELCGQCHTHEHGIRHPLGDQTRDPRSGDPMTCLSCHGIHDAPYDMYLHASEERDLCLNCHKDIGGRR